MFTQIIYLFILFQELFLNFNAVSFRKKSNCTGNNFMGNKSDKRECLVFGMARLMCIFDAKLSIMYSVDQILRLNFLTP